METRDTNFKIKVTRERDMDILSYVYRGDEYRIWSAYGDDSMQELNTAYFNFIFGWNMACIAHGEKPVKTEYSLTKDLEQYK